MKKIVGLLVFILCYNSIFFAQIELSKSATEENEKLILELCDKAYDIRYKQPDIAEKYALTADSLAVLFRFHRGQGEAKVVLGILAKNDKQYDLAKKLFQSAKDIRKKTGDFKGVASCDNNLGNIYWEKHRFRSAIENYLAGIKTLKENQLRIKLLGKLYNNLAIAYHDNGDFKLAAECADSSMILRTSFKDTLGLAYSKLNMGIILSDQGFLERARQNFEECLVFFKKMRRLNGQLKYLINIGKLDFREGNYQKALEHFRMVLPNVHALSRTDRLALYKNLGTVFQTTGKHIDSSLYYFNAALNNVEEPYSTPKDIADINYHIGRLYYDQGKYNESILHLEYSSRILDSVPMPALQMHVLFKLSENYARVNQFEKAFHLNKLSMELQDSLNQVHEKVMEYKLDYEMIKRDDEIRSVQYKQQRIISICVLLTIWIAVFFWFRNRSRRRSMQQKIDDMMKDQEIKTLQAKLEGQDQERIRIGQDLHDRLGMMLSTIKLYFQTVEEKIETVRVEKIEQFQKATELLDDACEEVRNIAHNMQTNTLVQFGLQEELKDLIDTLKKSQRIEVYLSTFGLDKRLDNQLEVKIYKMIQELIANALKHAEASELNIEINQFGQLINIMVQDNGRGFETERLELKSGMGLKNIRTRLVDLDGKMKIDSTVGRGTSISIDIPHQENVKP